MRDLFITNTLSKKKEQFIPIDAKEVRVYSCGPTTYDFMHIGNARAFCVGDLIVRVLRVLGYKVKFVRNFTDVDDKIIQRALEVGENPMAFSERFVQEALTDMDYLKITRPEVMPKVSECMDDILNMIQRIIDAKKAYVEKGEVLYSVESFPHYGKLSGRKLEDQKAGARVEAKDHKHHPSDFVLWKPSDVEGASWDSAYGRGRPGWHIECSAMIEKHLGDQIDIHHGGIDLIFPHHENEIAQSEAATCKKMSNFWCHHEFLNFGDEKMSKSLGNVITIRAFSEKYSAMLLKYAFVSVHYRSKIDWNKDFIARGISDLRRIYDVLLELDESKRNEKFVLDEKKLAKAKEDCREEILSSLSNDFNAPGALASFFTFLRLLRRDFSFEGKMQLAFKDVEEIFRLIEKALGFLDLSDIRKTLIDLDAANLRLEQEESGGEMQKVDEKKIRDLIERRSLAKKNRDFKTADSIRDELLGLNIVLKDLPSGETTWRVG